MPASFTVYKTFVAGEVLTASDLNASFIQFITNLEPIASQSSADKNGYVIVRAIGSYGSLTEAVTSIGATECALLINSTTSLTANTTVPANIQLIPQKPGMISKASTYTLTINGPVVDPGPIQWLSGFSAGDVTFGIGSVNRVYGEWFGAKGDDLTDCTVAINTARASFPKGEVNLGAGVFKTTGSLIGGEHGCSLAGAGRYLTIIKNYSAVGAHTITTPAGIRVFKVRDLQLYGNSLSGDGIHATENFAHIQLNNIIIYYSGGDGVDISEGYGIDLHMQNVRAELNYGKGFNLDATGASVIVNTVTATNCYANDNDAEGWRIGNISAATLTDCWSDKNTYGFQISGANVTLIGCTAEQNTVKGFNMASSTGRIVIINPRTWDQILPYNITAAADVTLIEPVSTSTPSGNALEVSSSGTGDNLLIGGSLDANVFVDPAGVLNRITASTWVFGPAYLEGKELGADAAAPTADRGRMYFRDNGSGKTQLVVRFNTGAIQVLATEP